MARMIPSVFPAKEDSPSPGEREVFVRLRDDPATADWTVLHSFDLPRHVSQVRGEADFIILVPGLGVLCLEVKAHLKVRRDDQGRWFMGDDEPTLRSPFKQSRDNMHSFIELLKRRRREDARQVVVWSAVIFTHTDFKVPATEWHEWEVLDQDSLGEAPISELIAGVLEKARLELPGKASEGVPSVEQCRNIAAAVRPAFEVARSPAGRRKAHEQELLTYTEAQYAALDNLQPDRNPRVVFVGPAGTGKTLLALEAARRVAIEGGKPLLLCFNRLLGKWLREQSSAQEVPFETLTAHALMLRLAGLSPEPGADASFWNDELPHAAMNALVDSGTPPQFDALVVDEAQDLLRSAYLEVFDLILKGGLSNGRWAMFGDFERQAIYDSADLELDDLLSRWGPVPCFSLRDNCRNTPAVAETATILGGLDPGYRSVLRPDDGRTPVTRYYDDEQEQADMLAEILEQLYDEGFAGEDIIILSTIKKGAAAKRLTSAPWKDRIKPFEKSPTRGFVRSSTVHAFKGLEAPVVILTDITEASGSDAQSLFYTGLTRPTDRLYVLASSDVAREIVNLVQQAVPQSD